MALAIETPLSSTAPRHLKVSAVGSLEPCEDAGCRAEAGGVASSCGRPVCPACGCSGPNLSAMQPPAIWDGLAVVCSCGHRWLAGREHETVLCWAELAECTCPDPCDRDHGNE